MWRYAGMQKFEFGEQRPHINKKGEQISVADWGIVVSCNWRITDKTGTFISQQDFVQNTEPRPNRVVTLLDELLGSTPRVERIVADDAGSVTLSLTHGYCLELMPYSTPHE